MTDKKWQIITLIFIIVLLLASCVSAPRIERGQYSQKYYTFSIPYDPADPENSPILEMALSLLLVNFPVDQARFIYNVLYMENTPDLYKDRLIRDHRDIYRSKMSAIIENSESEILDSNWRHAENVSIINSLPSGIIIKNETEIFEGGAHGLKRVQYYVLDLDRLRHIKIDDLFNDYQGDEIRSIVYGELRKYDNLEEDQPLSEGIYFTDEPELTFNFYVTDEGIGLHWDAYQIAPYSAGSIDIVVPWRMIRPIMLHSGMELLTKFNIYLFVG